MRKRQRCKPDNCIHRRTDIMRHIGKKYTLRLTGPVSLIQSILQKILLLHFPADFPIHTAESKYNA